MISEFTIKHQKPLMVVSALLATLFIFVLGVHAEDSATTACKGIAATGANCNGGGGITNIVQAIVKVLLFVVGVAAVIMIIIGGIRYIVSGGDQQAVTSAKNTILYAIVGLVVAIMAYAVVNYVFRNVSSDTSAGSSSLNGSGGGGGINGGNSGGASGSTT